MDLHMVPSGVRQAGDDLGKLAAEAKEKTEPLFATSDAAAAGNAGWRSSAAMLDCRRAWDGKFEQLVDQTSQMGQALIDSANLVQSADQESFNHLGNALHDLAGP